MMKKGAVAILLFFLVSSATCLAAADDAAAAMKAAQPLNERPKWPWYPMPKQLHRRTEPVADGIDNDYPFSWTQPPFFDPKIVECLKAFRVERICVHEILISFRTGYVNLGPECCQSIQQVEEDCVGPVFSRFNNPFFGLLLKEYCAHKPAPSPSPF